MADLRRHLLPGRRVARRRATSATPRATSLPHTFEVTEALARPRRAPPRRRGGVHPPDRPDREAQHHRRLPALGLPRPRLEPRRHLAAGPRHRDRAGAHRPAPRRCAGRRPPSGRSLVLRATLDSDAARTVLPAQHARRARARRRPAARRGRQRGGVDAHRRRAPPSGGRAPSATPTSTTSRAGRAARRRGRGTCSDERRPAHRPAPGAHAVVGDAA